MSGVFSLIVRVGVAQCAVSWSPRRYRPREVSLVDDLTPMTSQKASTERRLVVERERRRAGAQCANTRTQPHRPRRGPYVNRRRDCFLVARAPVRAGRSVAMRSHSLLVPRLVGIAVDRVSMRACALMVSARGRRCDPWNSSSLGRVWEAECGERRLCWRSHT